MIVHGINSLMISIRMFLSNFSMKAESRSNFWFFLNFSIMIFFISLEWYLSAKNKILNFTGVIC